MNTMFTGSRRGSIPSSPALSTRQPTPSSPALSTRQPTPSSPTLSRQQAAPPTIDRAFVTKLQNELTSISDTIKQLEALQKKNTEIIGKQSIIISDSENYINSVRNYILNINKELDTKSVSTINTYKKMISDNKTKQATFDYTIGAGRFLINIYNDVLLQVQRGAMNQSVAINKIADAKTRFDSTYAQMKKGGELTNLNAPLLEVTALSNPPRPPPKVNVSNFSDYGGAAPAWTNSIPSWLICDWYYVLFVLNLALLIILVGIFVFASKKKLSGARLNAMIIPILFSSVSTLFFYLMCDRSLKPTAY